MDIRLTIGKSVHDNAAAYYDEAKEAKEKLKGAQKALEETKKEIDKAKKDEENAEKKKASDTRLARKKEWYEKFHYFFLDSGKLVVGGRSADQNDLLYNRYFDDPDLFFHADIQGSAACIVKLGNGIKDIASGSQSPVLEAGSVTDEEMAQVAQFAASFSNAWKNGNAAVDVYCVSKKQVSKHSTGGFIQKGAYAIVGERKWFRSVELKLRIGIENGIVVALPFSSKRKLEKEAVIIPGRMEKGEAVKKMSKLLGVHPDDVQGVLPAGRIALKANM